VGGLTSAEWVFGYASLASELIGSGRVAVLEGYRRVWGVATDNAHAIPGYKRYLLRSDGSAPDVFVAFLDVIEQESSTVNGVLAPIDDDRLVELDRRERNYDRIDVTAAIDRPPAGRVWTYVGSRPGRERLERGRRLGAAVVARAYADAVDAAFRALGDGEHMRFLASTDLDGLPTLDLERVDLPPAEPPV
jgi:Gamma-glutamyl cyclotransferase, AIG2-like